ncbi:MAG TPA: glycosyltransferase family 39 protein [Candidatus Acidoferrum sp.]|jgi:hypothetical protein|nr:glycosyltransferase family 39 protein [Candidatus Acidoferrum sp.]
MDNSKTFKKFGIVVGYAVLFVTSFWLLFYHLDNHLLWGDEAETAVLARNVVQFGIPRTFDGINYVVLHGTVDETPTHVWRWSPWMQNYLAASSFMLFGPTTWAARAPFALVGWCAVWLLALVSWKIYRNHWVTFASAALLTTSEAFLLHARQCRYYPISVFAEVIFVYGLYELLALRRRGVWLAALALVLQFYSNYIVATANLPALVCVAWMLRKNGRTAMSQVAMVFGIYFAAILPWLIYAHPWGQSKALGGENYGLKALNYLSMIHFYFIPFCIFLLPLAGFLTKSGNAGMPDTIKRWEGLLLLLMLLYLLTVLPAPGFYMRYQLPLLPLLCLLAAVWVFRYVRWRAVAVGLIIVQMSCNAFSYFSAFPFRQGHPLRFPLVEYVRGISAPYADRFTDVLDFLKWHAHPRESILSFDPEFPIMFYTPMVVYNGNIMAPPAGTLPDWILPLPASGVVAQTPTPLPDFFKPYYTPVVITVHNSYLCDSIPEPGFYQYRTVSAQAPFVFYKLTKHPNEPAR